MAKKLLAGLGAILLLGVGFVGGQIAPSVVPPSWSLAQNRLDFNDLNSTYDLLRSKFDGNIDSSKIMDGARAGLVTAAGDPYTVYLNAEQAKDLNDQLNGTVSGVGAEVGIKNNRLTVIAPVAGSPAAKAGLKAGDYIATIDGVDSSTLTLDQAVAKIRGPKDSKVKLVIERGSDSPIAITITRDVINVPSVTWSMKSEANGKNDIGYIQISEFGSDTATKIVQAAQDLKNQGARKVILDLRDNPGGYLDAAVTVVSQFVPEGKVVVQEKHGQAIVEEPQSQGGGLLTGLPVAILINGGSASASEITAGALRDDIGAKLIGEKSFGKGSVQDITNLTGGAELKITIAHWFTPSGQGIDKVGIKPQTVVPMTQADTDAGRDPQLDRAVQLLSS